ncbi:hypothetical protein J7K93_08015 [bacterium]|nr:hypothetical protein [bacterium]
MPEETLTKKFPIDTTMTFKNSGKFNVYGIVTDSKNLSDTVKVSMNVLPLNPSMNQGLKLVNEVEIEYSATLSDINSATLEIFKNNESEPFLTENVQNGYKKTFNYSKDKITKGHYKFVLESSDKNTTTQDTISVLEYAPEVNLSSVADSLKFNEGGSITITLPTPTDKNPEDAPKYSDVVSSDGKVSLSLLGKELKIKAVPNKTGDYQLQLSLTDGIIRNTKNLEGKLYDLLDVSGTLKDNEMHATHPGIIKVYNYVKDMLGNILDTSKIGEIAVDNLGNFSKRFDKRILDLQGDILVQARWVYSGADLSYVRTMKLESNDQRELDMVVVPYTGLAENNITPEDFRNHMAEVLTLGDAANPNIIVSKWIFNGQDIPADIKLDEIIISKHNPDITKTGYFSDSTAEQIKNRILDTEDIGAFFNGKLKKYNIPVNIVDTKDYSLPEDYGKIVLYPDENPTGNSGNALGGYTYVNDHTRDGYLDYAKSVVKVWDGIANKTAVAHELGRASDALCGNAITLTGDQTIMKAYGGNSDGPLFADRKTAKAIYEDSYVPGTGTVNFIVDNNLSLRDITGLSFLDGSKK